MRHSAIAIALVGTLALAADALAQEDWPGQPVGEDLSTPANLAEGRFLATGGEFGELRFGCVSCHGAHGEGDPSGAFPRLADQSAFYLYDTLRAFATGRRKSKVMGPIASSLTDGQMRALAAWFASAEGVPYPPVPGEPGTDRGQAIAQRGAAGVMACVSCHGQGLVGDAPVYPYLAGQSRPYIEQQLRLFRSGKRGGGLLGVMHDVAKDLSDDQIAAVAGYAASLRPQETTPEDGPAGRGTATPPKPIPRATGAVIRVVPQRNETVLPGGGGMGNGGQ